MRGALKNPKNHINIIRSNSLLGDLSISITYLDTTNFANVDHIWGYTSTTFEKALNILDLITLPIFLHVWRVHEQIGFEIGIRDQKVWRRCVGFETRLFKMKKIRSTIVYDENNLKIGWRWVEQQSIHKSASYENGHDQIHFCTIH